MANENLCEVDFSVRFNGFIRRKNGGKYPLYTHTQHGPQFWNTAEGQQMLAALMQPSEESQEVERKAPEIEQEKPEEKPQQEAAPEVKKSWLDSL